MESLPGISIPLEPDNERDEVFNEITKTLPKFLQEKKIEFSGEIDDLKRLLDELNKGSYGL